MKPDYIRRTDPNAVEDLMAAVTNKETVDLIAEVCRERGHEVLLVTFEDRFVVHVIASYNQFKAAQIEWLRRMIVGGVKATEDLF